MQRKYFHMTHGHFDSPKHVVFRASFWNSLDWLIHYLTMRIPKIRKLNHWLSSYLRNITGFFRIGSSPLVKFNCCQSSKNILLSLVKHNESISIILNVRSSRMLKFLGKYPCFWKHFKNKKLQNTFDPYLWATANIHSVILTLIGWNLVPGKCFKCILKLHLESNKSIFVKRTWHMYATVSLGIRMCEVWFEIGFTLKKSLWWIREWVRSIFKWL